jgi:hypothetical protein
VAASRPAVYSLFKIYVASMLHVGIVWRKRRQRRCCASSRQSTASLVSVQLCPNMAKRTNFVELGQGGIAVEQCNVNGAVLLAYRDARH